MYFQENITKSNQQDSNLQKQQIFSINIPSTWNKRKLKLIKRVIPQTKRKRANTDIDNLITEEIPKINTTENPQTIPEQAKMSVENSFLPNIDKKTKNIEDALKIININQNSGCIDLLATSLKTISYSLLSNINNINFGSGNQIGRNPTDILFSNITPADNATSISVDNITINNTTENNNTNLAVENQIGRNPSGVLFKINTPTTSKTTSLPSRNISTAKTIDKDEITIEEQVENTDIIENVANEELYPLEKDESMGAGQSNMQTDEPIMNS